MQPLILIVKDDALLALDIEGLLSEEGYRTALAATATETRKALLHGVPAAALVDMHLRDGMTGPGIARQLHEMGVPVIICSGETSGLDGVPAVARLTKPASKADILKEVQRAVRRRSLR